MIDVVAEDSKICSNQIWGKKKGLWSTNDAELNILGKYIIFAVVVVFCFNIICLLWEWFRADLLSLHAYGFLFYMIISFSA